MKIKENIGIVGNGFVGRAVQFGFSPNTGCDAETRVYDIDPAKSTHTLEETVNKSDFIFVSVPTPANNDGSINTDILEKALDDIDKAYNNERENAILIRSTVVPGTTWALQRKYQGLNLLFNPEFLTERSANFDFINQSRFVIGSSGQPLNEEKASQLSELFRNRFGASVSILNTNYETAEMVKYMTNTFFATKISFLNDMKLLADECNVIWEDAMEGFLRDGRIGHSHLNVPGHDGKMGFGGSCFPKDIQAMIDFGDSVGVDMRVLKAAWATNLEVRPEQDWKELKGRAVIDEK